MIDWLEITMGVILYLFLGLCTARNRYRALVGDSEQTGVAVALGFIWPVTIIFLTIRLLGYYLFTGIAFFVKYDND